MPAFDMSPAAQITDDFVHRRSRQRWAKTSRATHFVGTADLPQEADPSGRRPALPGRAISGLMRCSKSPSFHAPLS